MGELDNTLMIWIWGDNGASMEGTLTGTFNELTSLNGIPLTAEQQLELVLKLRRARGLGQRPMMAPHYSAAWAWAGNCPFQWGKQVALAPRRHARPDGRPLAGPDQGHAAACAASSPT